MAGPDEGAKNLFANGSAPASVRYGLDVLMARGLGSLCYGNRA